MKSFMLILALLSIVSGDAPPSEPRIPIYRYFSKKVVDHYYTNSYQTLRDGDQVYKYEGVGFYLENQPDTFGNSVPLYQYYQDNSSYNHRYTTKPKEINNHNKQILGYCYPEKYKRSDMVPLYRYHQSTKDDCLFTTAMEEIGENLQIGEQGNDNYEYMGIECYVFSSPGDLISRDINKDMEELQQNIDVNIGIDEQTNEYKNGSINNEERSSNWNIYRFIGLFACFVIISIIFCVYCYGKGVGSYNGEEYKILVI